MYDDYVKFPVAFLDSLPQHPDNYNERDLLDMLEVWKRHGGVVC